MILLIVLVHGVSLGFWIRASRRNAVLVVMVHRVTVALASVGEQGKVLTWITAESSGYGIQNQCLVCLASFISVLVAPNETRSWGGQE